MEQLFRAMKMQTRMITVTTALVLGVVDLLEA
jgi:hypothetical protein